MYEILLETIDELTAPEKRFAIREVEVRGQRLREWLHAPPTLRDLWLGSAAHGSKDYLVYEGQRISYSQAHEIVARLANYLSENGIGKGDRVAIAMRNYPEWMLCFWAVTCVGAVSVGINAWWVPEELKYGLDDCGAKLLFCDSERLHHFNKIRDRFNTMQVVGVRCDDSFDWVIPWTSLLDSPADLPEVDIDPDDDVCIFYTSGTTGRPKGAQLTNRGCTNNVFSTLFSTHSQTIAGARLAGLETDASRGPGQPQPSTILAAPLFHVTTNNGSAQLLTLLGGKLVHMYKWDPGEALRLIEAESITSLSAVPIMTRELFTHPDFSRRDTSSMRLYGGGGAPVQADLVETVSEEGRGADAAQGYGLTETCGMVAGSSGVFLRDKPGSAGRIVPIFEVQSINSEGNPLPVGTIGEICVRGVQVIKGYLNRPEATAETIVNGWLHTGDIGYVDEDNFIYLVDRAKDMVLRGGENVYCSEVEVVLYRFQGVKECAVFSVPDERLGEEVGAAIVPADGASLAPEQIREFCRDYLAAYKIPKHIWVMDSDLPRNASGKFLKRELQSALSLEDAK